jgi:hypothetical protein
VAPAGQPAQAAAPAKPEKSGKFKIKNVPAGFVFYGEETSPLASSLDGRGDLGQVVVERYHSRSAGGDLQGVLYVISTISATRAQSAAANDSGDPQTEAKATHFKVRGSHDAKLRQLVGRDGQPTISTLTWLEREGVAVAVRADGVALKVDLRSIAEDVEEQ